MKRGAFVSESCAIELKGITKVFGDVVANEDVSLTVEYGEVLSLLGENGSGKTTLMNMLAGVYYPDSGHIYIGGIEVNINSPKDSLELGIGMIHQHFKLVELFSAAENIALANNEKGYDLARVEKRVQAICDKYGFELDPSKKIYDMSVSEKQTVEIIKVLYRNADILILDEPTAVLTPQETEKLFAVMRNMREDGKAIIIITHKLHEVLAISDRVSVLRKGRYIGTVKTADATAQSLTEMMVGEKVSLNIDRPDPVDPVTRIEIKGLSVRRPDGILAVDDVSFTACSGEILGIAGIAGSGQKELLEAIAGLQPIESGSITYTNPENGKSEELVGMNPLMIRELGVRLSFVPEDRLGMGLVGNMGMSDNMMLRSYRGGVPFFTSRKEPKKLAEKIIEQLNVITPGVSTPVRRLSGGNVQKVLVGREIAFAPTVLMAAYPVRGLDINSSHTIYDLLNRQKKSGVAVIYVGEDLDVLLDLCDKIAVICGGRISAKLDARTTTKEEVGYYMMKHEKDGENKA